MVSPSTALIGAGCTLSVPTCPTVACAVYCGLRQTPSTTGVQSVYVNLGGRSSASVIVTLTVVVAVS